MSDDAVDRFLDSHDCSKCHKSEQCPVMGCKDFFEEHREECRQLFNESEDCVCYIAALLAQENPMVMIKPKELLDGLITSVMFGYAKGRTYQDIPEVFKRM